MDFLWRWQTVYRGTIAFIMGFYERFLTALHQLFGEDRAERRHAFFYLVKFVVGRGIGMAALCCFCRKSLKTIFIF